MIVHFITAIVVALVVILFAWAIFRTIRKPMPGSLIPMLIGLTVIAYGIYSEYTWESRTLATMPASIEVVNRVSGTSVFSPWSYVVKRTSSFSVVDTHDIRRNPEQPGYSMLDLLVLQRFNPVMRVRQMIDCNELRRADLAADPKFDEDGLPTDLEWDSVPEDHALMRVACEPTVDS